MAIRVEKDLLGLRDVPAQAYWGVQTLRAVENFPITGTQISNHPYLVKGLATVKLACAAANYELGVLPQTQFEAIEVACTQVIAGQFHDQFIVDVIQGGAGTSTNMNANEVIANLALEHLGKEKGDYSVVNPNDHVNLSQSTNDAYPTALKVALLYNIADLQAALTYLEDAFSAKAIEFHSYLKMGSTQLQDAVPMTLGQEYRAFANMVAQARRRLADAATELYAINLGATAIGTGINAPSGYAQLVATKLADLSGLPVFTAPDLIQATVDVSGFVDVSSALKRAAVQISKISNDIRLLSSGPRAGLGEINIPATQAGSSIMPGKVNPVIPEVVSQVAFEIIGNDVTIAMAAEAGQLQLNAFEPVIFYKLDTGISHLAAACRTLVDNCINGTTANTDYLRGTVDNSIGLVTALNPILGYQASTSVAAEALTSGRNVAEIVLERNLMSAEDLAEVLSAEKLANLAPKA